ncbi:MAG: Clp1/GlmU family protein [bacterium]
MTGGNLDVPDAWTDVPSDDLTGVVMVVGAADTGNWLGDQLEARNQNPVYLDGDPGQGSLGPPSTMTLSSKETKTSWFVGSSSPRGNMLSVTVGARNLVNCLHGDKPVLYDTSGLVDPGAGGLYLKRALVDLLRPEAIVALQHQREIEPILEPLRRRSDHKLVKLPVSKAAEPKTQASRRNYRNECYRNYFGGTGTTRLSWDNKAVWPRIDFETNRLVGLCEDSGYCRGLGIVRNIDYDTRQIEVQTPLETPERVGDLRIDPENYVDRIDPLQ